MHATQVVLFLALTLLASAVKKDKQGAEVLGYWENWNNVNWWGNNIPGNCLMGCAQPAPLMNYLKTFSSLNYGFTFLTENPNPDQIECGTIANCPVWDGRGIYIAHASQTGATVVTDATDINDIDNSPGLIGISEVCRLARQGPYPSSRRCKISLGGWSDWARLSTAQNGKHVGQLVAKMVLLSFADGVDLDFEHLSEYAKLDPASDEFGAFIAMVKSIRDGFDAITPDVWVNTAKTRLADLTTAYNGMPDWQKAQSPYYPTNIQYMKDLISIGRPSYLEISFTTRFNGFINTSSPFDYLDPKSPVPPPFLTDNEVSKLWSKGLSDEVDTVNIMAYDAGSPAGALILNLPKVVSNFISFGPVPGAAINLGLEPGDQYGDGVWEGLQPDVDAMKYVRSKNGGIMMWSINPTTANSEHWVPIVSQAAVAAINPTYPYPPAPVFTKCDATTGWITSQ